MDLRLQVTEHLATRPIPFSWVPSHRSLSDATSPDDRETILAMMRLTGGQRQQLPSPYLHVSLRNRPQLSFAVVSHPPQQRNGYSNAAEHLGLLVFIGSLGCP